MACYMNIYEMKTDNTLSVVKLDAKQLNSPLNLLI
jgi:hypothetical protein